MGICNLQLLWLRSMQRSGVFDGLSSVIELGPQDFSLNPVFVRQYVGELTGSDERFGELLIQGGAFSRWAVSRLYRCMGLEDYHSIDLGDPRADYLLDLGEPLNIERRFGVVTNFGTLEHVFNIGVGFKNCHDLVEPGGVMLHVLPSFGDVAHGFYNIHRGAYLDLAKANGYEVVSLVNVHDVFNTHERLNEEPPEQLPEFPLFTSDEEWEDVETRFAESCREYVEGRRPSRIMNFIYVGLRKIEGKAFVYPVQSIYSW